MATHKTNIDIINSPIKLPCGLELPNRLVKCPMQETLAQPPLYDPPVDGFANLYELWSSAKYGLIITGQVQVDIRFLSVPGDVVSHSRSHEQPHFERWKQWASVAKRHGTPCIVQLAHPGRMSPAGAGVRPSDMQALCPSSVPVTMGESWLDKIARDKVLGIPKAMTHQEIDEVVKMFVDAAVVCKDAGFDGVQLHGAHGFLLSQFLSPWTNRRTDEYGGDPERRLTLLKRLVRETRAVCPKPFCLGVKLNSADYMVPGEGLQVEEGLQQVKWLVECGDVDFVEISGGNAETATSKLHTSISGQSLEKVPEKRESTRIREGFFTDFAEAVQKLNTNVPIQLSGGFRSRVGMADAIESGVCDLIGLGRAAVLEPQLPSQTILNEDVADSVALARPHIVKGQWIGKFVPAKIVGAGLSIGFFYHNMRRLGHGLMSDPDISIPKLLLVDTIESIRSGLVGTMAKVLQALKLYKPVEKMD